MMRSHRLVTPRPRRGRPAPPELMDDAIAEILLRLPPDEPACLVHASLVCKLWHKILSEPTFPDRYREFHGTPPLLGFLRGSYTSGYDKSADRFVPVAATRIPLFRQPEFGCRALDCRHGRVLFDMVDDTGRIRTGLAVWDLVTGEHIVLRVPDPAPNRFGHSSAVICAAAGCNHQAGCAGGSPFQVVLVSTSYNDGTSAARAWVYSSETTAWSTPTSVQILFGGWKPLVEMKRAAIVGDQIYFLLTPGAGILKYDLGKGCLTVIGTPSMYTYYQPGILMATEDGSLGFNSVNDVDSNLHLWATKVSPIGWVRDRVILLNNLPIPTIQTMDTYNKVIEVVGFAEVVDILLLAFDDGRGFMLELKSKRFRKVSKPE